MHPIRNRIRFMVESLLLRGTFARLGVAAGLIALVAIFMGLLGFVAAFGTDQAFAHPWEAIWWAFLRLSDPGYLGDDRGFMLRLVSTIATVAGCVLFLGVLVAILTQGLNELIRRFEMGLAPISARNHVILLGWSKRTPTIVQKMMASEQRVKRFLRRIGAKRLRLVLLVNEVTIKHTSELRGYLGSDWNPREVILRSGSPLRLDHLKRVDYLRATTIVLPATDRVHGRGDVTASDDAAIKTILSIANSVRSVRSDAIAPLLVAEFHDARKIPVVLRNYHGPIEVIASDEVVSRMIAQMVRHPQISHVYRELLSHAAGNELFVRDCPPELVGAAFWKLAESFQRAILIGVTRPSPRGVSPLLNPPADYRLRKEDKLVYIAEEWSDGTASGVAPTPWPMPSEALKRHQRADHRILILGWSRRVPALLEEFESYHNQHFEVVIVSRLSIEERAKQLDHHGVELERIRVEQVDADYTIPERLKALRPETFDTIVCLASDLMDSEEAADARSLVAHSILDDLPANAEKAPRVLVELLDELNATLIDSRCEYLTSPQILSHMLVQVGLRRELNAIYQELFNSSATEIFFRDFERYRLQPGAEVTFPEIQAAGRAHGEIVLGIFKASRAAEPHGGIHLNPDRHILWTIESGDQFVVLGK